jgi:lysophospholipase-2
LEFVRGVVEWEAREVGGFERVFLGGISQGCAMAVAACLAVSTPLAGFVAFSGWCPFAELGSGGALVEWLRDVVGDSSEPGTAVGVEDIWRALRISVLVEHAIDDEVVPPALCRDLRDTLMALGAEVQMVEYEDGGHWINEPKGIDDMVHFIKSKSIT